MRHISVNNIVIISLGVQAKNLVCTYCVFGENILLSIYVLSFIRKDDSMSKSYKTNSCKKEFKPLQELNLIDSFLFGASTEKIQDAEFIAKLIIERATNEKVDQITVVPEKELAGIDISHHGIRMDLYVEEYEDKRLAKVYDIEPNKYNPTELPMRSRYCQSLTDVKLLNSGEIYETLPEYISIWILPYDPFGENRMLYTVRNCVEEFPELVYNDGVKKLFLYTGGEMGGTKELKSLLQYFGDSNARNVTDTDLEHLHNIVENVKCSQKAGKRYMTLQDMIDYEKKESFEEGVALGRKEGVRAYVDLIKEMKIPTEQILDQLVQKFALSEDEAKAYLEENN